MKIIKLSGWPLTEARKIVAPPKNSIPSNTAQGQKMYRGDSGLNLNTMTRMLESIDEKMVVSPEGGAFDCKKTFSTEIWKGWTSDLEIAAAKGATDRKSTNQNAGKPQGDYVMKTTWGQRVVSMPGKPRTDFERAPTAHDLFDILMVGFIVDESNIPEGARENVGTLRRLVYSPGIGSFAERRARLIDLMEGKMPKPLSRRPQIEDPYGPK